MANGGGEDRIHSDSPIWRHMQTAKCLGSNMGGCPIQGKTDYDVIRVGFVESLMQQLDLVRTAYREASEANAKASQRDRDQRRYIAHISTELARAKARIVLLEANLEQAAADERVSWPRFPGDHPQRRSYFRDKFIDPEIVEPVHDYGSPEMSRREAWRQFETRTGIDPSDHDAVKNHFTEKLMNPRGSIGPAQRFDLVDGVWWRLL